MIQNNKNTLRTVDELLLEYQKKKIQVNSSKLHFRLLGENKDVYNITAPFWDEGKLWIAGRVEARDSEYSRIAFFTKEGDFWQEEETEPMYLQDPFTARIGKELVLGGVEVFDDAENPGHLNYRTVFYRGTGIRTLCRFAAGPDRMKDIRLCDLEEGNILVLTRPQGEKGGRGTIGYTFLKSLDELDKETIGQAKLLENQFIPEEWGGANELHRLADGKIGVLSHIAKFDSEGNRHYYASAFCFHPADGWYSPMKLIAERKDFQPGPSKRPDLEDVIFSGGLIRLPGNTAELYCGVSDAEGQKVLIEDPFAEFEQETDKQ